MCNKINGIWITVPNMSHFDEMKFRAGSCTDESLNGHLRFDDLETAKAFLKDVKIYIKELYCNKYNMKERGSWMDDKWINSISDDKQ